MLICWLCKNRTNISIEDYGDHICPACGVMLTVLNPNASKLAKEDKPKTSYEDWQESRQPKGETKMIFEEIFTKRVYQKNGADKVVWLKCGTLRINDTGKKFIELNHLPDVTFFVFPKKEKTNQPEQATSDTWLAENEG